MTAGVFVLFHSPLVGPLTWRAIADVLQATGRTAVVPSLSHAMASGPPYYEKLANTVADAARAQGGQSPMTLVGHSGAGALLPAVADALDSPVCATVFVDSVLPHPGVSWFHDAPTELAAHLRSLARDGVLPPWDRWFAPNALAELLPDPELRNDSWPSCQRCRWSTSRSRHPRAGAGQPTPGCTCS